ncbi:hypothetical protein BJ741DRAFT_616527 [Chytriomyces cf. hyalinus JEL632]|nr:hypothetical protein BJ741DRAFT_616527 [Chytriomyces cf. hyalinus JEL632]
MSKDCRWVQDQYTRAYRYAINQCPSRNPLNCLCSVEILELIFEAEAACTGIRSFKSLDHDFADAATFEAFCKSNGIIFELIPTGTESRVWGLEGHATGTFALDVFVPEQEGLETATAIAAAAAEMQEGPNETDSDADDARPTGSNISDFVPPTATRTGAGLEASFDGKGSLAALNGTIENANTLPASMPQTTIIAIVAAAGLVSVLLLCVLFRCCRRSASTTPKDVSASKGSKTRSDSIENLRAAELDDADLDDETAVIMEPEDGAKGTEERQGRRSMSNPFKPTWNYFSANDGTEDLENAGAAAA